MFRFPVLLSMLSLVAAAHSAETPHEEVQVTAGRIEESASQVSAAVSIVDSQDILNAAPLIAADLLRGVPGAFVQQTTPGQGIPIVRGLKGSEVLHLVDGFRLNNALFRNAPNQYVALVDAFMLDRVEVVRGPAPALYGSDAMGGVVQMLTTLPELGANPRLQGHALVDYQSADEALTTHLSLSRAGQRTGVMASATYLDVGERRTGDGFEASNTAYTSRALRGVLLTRPTDQHEWLFDVQYLRQPGTPRYDELVAGFGQDQPASAEFSFEPNDRLLAHVRHRWHHVSEAIDELEMHLGYQVMHDDRVSRDFSSTSRRRERNKSAMAGFTVQAHSKPGSHSLTYGLEYYSDKVTSSRMATDILTGDTALITSRFPTGSTMDSMAVYVGDSVILGERLSIDFGARYSRFDIELPAADRPIGTDLELDDLTGDLGLVYELQPGWNLVANLGRGFRAPNIFDLGTLGPRPGNRFNIGNPDLGPEKVVTVDLGLKYASQNLIAEVIAWQADYRDKIDSVPTGDIDASGRTVVQSRNTARAELWGVESGLHFFSPRSRFELEAVLNYTRGEQRDAAGPVQPADRIPPLNGSLLASLQLHSQWRASLGLRFARPQDRLSDRDRGDPRIDPDGTAGWAVVDLGLSRTLRPNLDLRVRLDNVFDARYREHASGIDAPGRNLGIGIRANF